MSQPPTPPGVTGTASPAAPASAVAAARDAAAGGPWRRPRRAGDRRRVDANRRFGALDRRLDAATMDRRSGCPGRLDAATMDRQSGHRPFSTDPGRLWLIAVALVLVGAVAGGYFDASPIGPTSARSDAESSAGPHDYKLRRRPARRGLFRPQGSVRRPDRGRQGGPVHDRARVRGLLRRGDGQAAATRPTTRSRRT